MYQKDLNISTSGMLLLSNSNTSNSLAQIQGTTMQNNNSIHNIENHLEEQAFLNQNSLNLNIQQASGFTEEEKEEDKEEEPSEEEKLIGFHLENLSLASGFQTIDSENRSEDSDEDLPKFIYLPPSASVQIQENPSIDENEILLNAYMEEYENIVPFKFRTFYDLNWLKIDLKQINK